MSDLFILRGIPGSGKTTLAHFLEHAMPGTVAVAADDFMVDEDGNYAFDRERLWECHLNCQKKVHSLMAEGLVTNIVVHNTSTMESELEPYLNLASDFRFRVFTLIVENRHGSEDQHSVPKPTKEKMKQRFSICL